MIVFKLDDKLKKENLSRREFARRIDARTQTINDYCNNEFKQINADNLDKICKYFKCNIDDILEFRW